MWHSFPSPGSESSRALISSCQPLTLPDSPPWGSLWLSPITLWVLRGSVTEKLGRFPRILSHLRGQAGPANPQSSSQKTRYTHWVINSFSLSSYLACHPFPWASLCDGGWGLGLCNPHFCFAGWSPISL